MHDGPADDFQEILCICSEVRDIPHLSCLISRGKCMRLKRGRLCVFLFFVFLGFAQLDGADIDQFSDRVGDRGHGLFPV